MGFYGSGGPVEMGFNYEAALLGLLPAVLGYGEFQGNYTIITGDWSGDRIHRLESVDGPLFDLDSILPDPFGLQIGAFTEKGMPLNWENLHFVVGGSIGIGAGNTAEDMFAQTTKYVTGEETMSYLTEALE